MLNSQNTPAEIIALMQTEDLTQESAAALWETNWWDCLGFQATAVLQLHQERLCMPFGKFQEALSFALGRTVLTHEFRDPDRLKAELLNLKKAPDFQEILEMIPPEKRLIVDLDR